MHEIDWEPAEVNSNPHNFDQSWEIDFKTFTNILGLHYFQNFNFQNIDRQGYNHHAFNALWVYARQNLCFMHNQLKLILIIFQNYVKILSFPRMLNYKILS